MSLADDADLIERFGEFYRNYYHDEIGELALKYPNERRSLYIEWGDLYRYDPNIADDFVAQPGQMLEYAEEALRLHDKPVDVKLGNAHVRIRGLADQTGIRDIRADHVGNLVAVQGIVRKATDVRPKMQEAAFECQRCGTLTRIPQSGGGFQEPHECQGCERQGPFAINFDQSEFVDAQKLRIQESPEGLRGGETPQAIDVHIEDDITGKVTAGDHVTATGVLHLDQQENQGQKSAIFDFYMEGLSIEVEDEQFEEMDITEEDERAIIELSSAPDLYEKMVDSLAPSIYGYREEKLAIIMQLFSGVRKELPDGSKIRGDLHMLLIGDPGTGKCVKGDTRVTLSDGSEVPIRELVESNLDDPKPVDDGVWDEVDFEVPSMAEDGTLTTRRATKVWKREAPDHLYRVRTESGRCVEVTPSHPLFVANDGSAEATVAEDLEVGGFVAVPRSLPVAGDDSLDVSIRRSRSRNAVRLDVPERMTPWLGRLLGYVVAEGYVQKHDSGSGTVYVTNNDREILDDVADGLDRLGVNYAERTPHGGKTAREVVCSSSELVSFLESIEPAMLGGSGGQRVPDAVMRATRPVKRGFLSALVDAEGTVSPKQREVSVSSTSHDLLEGVRSLLLAFGIDSQLRPKAGGSYRLRVSGSDFAQYVERIGFVTERKRSDAEAMAEADANTNRDVVPGVGGALRELRETLGLTQAECGLPRGTYRHYEYGDRNPSRQSFHTVLETFEAAASGGSAAGSVATDGGVGVGSALESLRTLAHDDIGWDRIESIERVEPEEEWVYDLEIERTHNYLTNNVVSHNSQLLQYIRNLAPRSVYTSGKGSSSAGLCVTGDTLIHTEEGFRRIEDIAREKHPDPVTANTAAEHELGLYSFETEAGAIDRHESSHVWRMPAKPCRRIETSHGKRIEASTNTPVLTCGESGLEWKPIGDVSPGDYVAAPAYRDIERTTPPVEEFVEYTNEKVRLAPESIEFLRERLWETYGTLRDAAAALDLTEDFIYDSLSNRFVPIDRLDRILEAVDATRDDLRVRRAMLAHGEHVRLPMEFDDELLYLVGLVFGDGDIALDRRDGNRGLVRISNGDEALLERAAEIIERKFDKTVEVEYQEERVPCIRLNSATVARFFSNLGMESPKTTLELDERLTTAEHADAFLRGLMDADGSVSTRDETAGSSSIQFSTISEPLAEQVQLMLDTYGVSARLRTRDRRGEYTLESGQTIESKHVQHHLTIYGRHIDTYASEIGFESAEKQAALSQLVGAGERRDEKIPVGSALATAEIGSSGGSYYTNLTRADNPGRQRARDILGTFDLGELHSVIEEAVEADLTWEEVVDATDTGEKEVFDLTVPETHNFLGNGIVTHNTAAAVRDDFGDGQQWTLEAGALVLADQGIAAIDELDKMRCVTGDTRVRLGDRTTRIRNFAAEAAETGTIEHLPNGRTIRDVDAEAWTMTDDGRLVKRPVTAIHEYDAPETLCEVTLQSGEVLTSTMDHPYFVFEDGERVEKPAEALTEDDWVYVPSSEWKEMTDGGPVSVSTDESARDPSDVTLTRVREVRERRADPDQSVYDLTIDRTHNFIANSMVVHNSEDRSAMHEALEQQSYHPDTEVLLADGRRVRIGEFVDERMSERPEDVVEGIDCEILPVDDVRVHSTDLETNETTKLPVDRVSRHEAPDEFVRVTFSNGRSVTVTPEHPMFVDRGGEVGTVEARDIEEGSFVPAPRKLPNSGVEVELGHEAHLGKEKDVRLPERLTGDLGEVLGFLVAEGHSYAGSAHEIGFSNQDERLLSRMGRLMNDVFGMRSSDTTNAAGTVTKRWISTKLYRWFERNFPEVMHTARDKRVPARVLGASEEVIRRFLVGAFAGDGGVESEAMSFSTASEGLAQDYADALAKVGVASRIHHDIAEDSWKVYVMGDSTERFVDRVVEPADDRYEQARAFVERSNGTRRHHDTLPTSAAREIRELKRLLGVRLTGQFGTNLDEGYGVQVETVRSELDALRERSTAVREALDRADDLAAVRAAIGWSGRQLADRLEGATTSPIHYAEDGGYDAEARARLADRARRCVLDALEEFERRSDELEERGDLRFYRVTDVETVPNDGDDACEWVYDVTVEPTNTFVSQGIVLHNSISISKAGINATLKSRCSLLGAANPKYGRFDEYEPIAEQIDLEPALVSRFDLIFTITDKPDAEKDRDLAEHIIKTNFAGELHTHRANVATSNVSQEEVDSVTEEVEPAIDADLLRKYVAFAKRECYPTMTEEAKEAIREFYVTLRGSGDGDDSPVPVTARKLEALVRLAEASARIRLSDTVTTEDTDRVIDIVRSSLEDVGMDPETGEFDADMVEAGTSKSQRDRIKNVKGIIRELQDEYERGAPFDEVVDRAEQAGIDRSKVEHEIQKLKNKGDIYEPQTDHLRVV